LAPDGDVLVPGTNAKMTEFQAAMGLLMLKRFPAAVAHMGLIAERYRVRLATLPGITLPSPAPGVTGNHGFLPILVEETAFGMSSEQLAAALTRFNVFARRYFSPLVSQMRVYRRFASRHSLSHAAAAAQRVLALPTYADLALEDVDRICDILGFIQAAGASAAPSV
jgi:dTDP-4-amino-4,6-dideoxygalactose transaminase